MLKNLLALFGLIYITNGMDIDVGCRASKAKLGVSLMEMFLEVHKSCTNGGLWQNIQCKTRYKCQCVYVDSGKPINELVYKTKVELDENCPIKTSETSDDVCVDPPVQYPCDADKKKYRFNQATGSCEAVKNRSCFGFQTIEQCQKKCQIMLPKCTQPENNGNDCGSSGGIRYRFEPTLKKCQAFFYTGCGGNENRFLTKWNCEQNCDHKSVVALELELLNPFQKYIMTLPKWLVTKENLRNGFSLDRTTFNEIRGFATQVVAINQQVQSRNIINIDWKNPKADIICKQEAKTGMCRAYFRRWYYDYKEGICKNFIYGGCNGNQNRFTTKSKCEDMCIGVAVPKSFRREKSVGTSQQAKDNTNTLTWTYQ